MLIALLLACTGSAKDLDPSDDTDAPDSTPTSDPDTAPGSDSDDPAIVGARNLLLISVDTLRRDGLSWYGGQADTAFLDSLLDRGHTYTNLRSCSDWTFPGVTCALTGADLVESGFLMGQVESAGDVPDSLTLLGEALQAEGFSTALVSGNSILGPGQGFERSYDELFVEDLLIAEDVVDRGLGFLDAMDERWMLHLHFMDPHVPYQPPLEYLTGDEPDSTPWDLTGRPGIEQMANALAAGEISDELFATVMETLHYYYDGELTYLDDQLERLWGELEARGALDDTLVIFWSDHGESWGERDVWLHQRSLYRAETLALGARLGPGIEPAVDDQPMSLRDVPGLALEGLGLAPAYTPIGEPRFADAAILSGFHTAIDVGDRRLLFESGEGRLLLFDVAEDPQEQIDLSTEDAATTAALWKQLQPRAQVIATSHPDLPVVWPDGF